MIYAKDVYPTRSGMVCSACAKLGFTRLEANARLVMIILFMMVRIVYANMGFTITVGDASLVILVVGSVWEHQGTNALFALMLVTLLIEELVLGISHAL